MFPALKLQYENPPDKNDNVIIKVDPSTGFCEFPAPGDSRKYTLPQFVDPEEDVAPSGSQSRPETYSNRVERDFDSKPQDFWMPDRLCKVCYGCEESFTMYRRKHHCRMCGQIFCNQCSSHYIDGVRACRLCHDQLSERLYYEKQFSDSKLFRRRDSAIMTGAGQLGDKDRERQGPGGRGAVPNRARRPPNSGSTDLGSEGAASSYSGGLGKDSSTRDREESKGKGKSFHSNNLQNRASRHLEAIVGQLVEDSAYVSALGEKAVDQWKKTIVGLVREVVASVDPNVRKGDSLDIRPYVKLKVVPGGAMSECVYVDGVVFRKTVSHKKMMEEVASQNYLGDSESDGGSGSGSETEGVKETTKTKSRNPRILLLAGGIDFQRTDARLSSLDTLIEQEERYMEILVEKIMSLRPDVILVGKAVARRAQELLCEHKVAVMQNVKPHLLERISRMTGAVTLPSTDHMIQH
jgi:TCP-1/cpn60 chaperonin family/FYVE zinc finger